MMMFEYLLLCMRVHSRRLSDAHASAHALAHVLLQTLDRILMCGKLRSCSHCNTAPFSVIKRVQHMIHINTDPQSAPPPPHTHTTSLGECRVMFYIFSYEGLKFADQV